MKKVESRQYKYSYQCSTFEEFFKWQTNSRYSTFDYLFATLLQWQTLRPQGRKPYQKVLCPFRYRKSSRKQTKVENKNLRVWIGHKVYVQMHQSIVYCCIITCLLLSCVQYSWDRCACRSKKVSTLSSRFSPSKK